MQGETTIKKWISPTVCLTHACQLNCIYCYEKQKDNHSRMNYYKAIEVIDSIFENAPSNVDGVEICFIGGEPLLEYNLIKQIVEYYRIKEHQPNKDFIFSATTNGALLTKSMKEWLSENKDMLILCLSLDGTKETQDHNRDNSFDKIDLEFFLNTYPDQGVKMTLSDFSLPRLYENVVFIHSIGFKRIRGVNLFEGDFDFSNEKYIEVLIPQLKKLVDFYSLPENEQLYNALFDKRLELTRSEFRRKKKNCGIGGYGVRFYDVDGESYPCVMCTPMTLTANQLKSISTVDFEDDSLFVDSFCNESCYIYPVCSNCAGSNYIRTGEFNKRDYSKCKIKKLEVLFCSELMARKIINNPKVCENDTVLFHTIEAIKEIKTLYYPMFQKYIEST